MKKLFFLITLYSLLNTSANAQWWVSGGNLLWTYGNVSITNGDLILLDDLELSGEIHFLENTEFELNTSLTIRDFNSNRIAHITGTPGQGLTMLFGDYMGIYNSVHLSIDDNEIYATNLKTDALTIPNMFVDYNVSDPPTAEELNQSIPGPDGAFKIVRDTDSQNNFYVYRIEENNYLYFPMIIAQ